MVDVETVAEILKELQGKNRLFISIVPPYYVRFLIDRDHLEAVLNARGLSQKDFQTTSSRVAAMLLAALSEREESFLEHEVKEHVPAEETGTPEQRSQVIKLLRSQLDLVKATLIDEHLRGRYDLKISSKAPAFAELDWDIKLKTDDANVDIKRFPYTTLKIRFQRDFSDSPFAILGGGAFDSLQINLTVDEVKYLLEELEKVHQRLSNREQELRGSS